MNRVTRAKVSTPAKFRIVPDTRDEARHTLKLGWWVYQAFAVAQNVTFIQIHVNGMTHQVVAIDGWGDNGWAWDWLAEFPEGTGNQYLRNAKCDWMRSLNV